MFGSYDADTLENVLSATCGKRVTAAIIGSTDNIGDITMSYKRAVSADPYNAKILRQFDLFKNIDQYLAKEKDSTIPLTEQCILCNGGTLCPFCQMKNDFRDLIGPHGSDDSSRHKIHNSLESVVNMLLKEEIP